MAAGQLRSLRASSLVRLRASGAAFSPWSFELRSVLGSDGGPVSFTPFWSSTLRSDAYISAAAHAAHATKTCSAKRVPQVGIRTRLVTSDPVMAPSVLAA